MKSPRGHVRIQETSTFSRASTMRKYKAKTLLMFGLLCLLVFPVWKDIFRKPAIGHGQKDVEWDANPENPPTAKIISGYSSPTCRQNASAANITGFEALPRHVQDFLYYRHCRRFPMLLDVPDKCGGAGKSAGVFLLLVIKSTPVNYNRREVLRKTWAKERLHNGAWIRRIFISGTTESGFEKERLNKLVEVEQHEYKDILQWDFRESFFNLTLKQVLFLEWMERNCPNVRFLLNGDDDVFANTDNMIEYLQGLPDNDGSKHLFAGHHIKYMEPIRIPDSKYYVPVQVQPADVYPPYCSGGGYLLSGYTALVLCNTSRSVTIHPIDDVYMGMCLAKAQLDPVSHVGFKPLGLHFKSDKVDVHDPCFYKELLLVHGFLPARIYFMWHKVHDPDLKC